MILPQVLELVLTPQTGESDAASQQTIGSFFWNPQMDFLKLTFSSSGSLDVLPICSIFAQSSRHLLISTQVCFVVHLFRTQFKVVTHKIKRTGTKRKIIFEIQLGHLNQLETIQPEGRKPDWSNRPLTQTQSWSTKENKGTQTTFQSFHPINPADAHAT